jgi:hypothetical protein
MGKVYRLHQGKDGTGWFPSQSITKDELKTIKTDGRDIATSIPSPFARIDLVKSAFAWVADNGVEGSSAQHRLVSEALDVAQLLFLYPKYSDKFKIVSWDPSARMGKIAQSQDRQHVSFAETLKVFWNQDSAIYNFDKVRCLYFLLNSSNQLVGGTSPATVFFSAPDARSSMRELTITSGSNVLFDGKSTSLAKRDESFASYIFSLSRQPNFSKWFPEMYLYLEKVFDTLNGVLRQKVANLTPQSLSGYRPCPVMGNENNPCEVLGIPLGVEEVSHNRIEQQSDFVIQADLQVEGLKPLVLPQDTFNKPLTYTTTGVVWNSSNRVPYRNDGLNGNSVLPIQGDAYPWLSMGNFLEDKIIELPYMIDSGKFVTAGAGKHLLPLTPLFFKYFGTDKVPGCLKLTQLAGGGVEVKLEIPVKNGERISFRKKYSGQEILKLEIHLAVLPFVKTPSIELDYTLGLLDKRTDRTKQIDVQCYEKGKAIPVSSPVVRKAGSGGRPRSIYFRTKSFDLVRVGDPIAFGCIVPIFKASAANRQISFAMDFGTTNTHIEYKDENNAEQALNVSRELPMWQSLIDRTADNDPIHLKDEVDYDKELLPYQFSANSTRKFPFRTAITYNESLRFNRPMEVFTDLNNFFLFEKDFYDESYKLETKLKWGNYHRQEHRALAERYIECLMIIVLYKTLALNGDPQKAKIYWFYPVSMDSFEQKIFFEVWQNSYKKIFRLDNADNVVAIPESIAPYLHYRSSHPGLSLSIDIGGGSSDIAVFRNAANVPEFISSFKFAGNSIFGDGFAGGAFAGTSDTNGFVQKYRGEVLQAVSSNANKHEILANILDKRKDSADFSSFLFSLENEKDVAFNFTDRLRRDKKLKLPILIFYGAVFYYAANLMRRQGLKEMPGNILLSGTAAKTIRILDPNPAFTNIARLCGFMFGSIMSAKTTDPKIALAENAKEITCKGVLRSGITSSIMDCPVVFWVGGVEASTAWGKALDKKADLQQTPLYGNVSEGKDAIENSVKEFFSLMDKFKSTVNLDGEFGIDLSAYNRFLEIRSLNIVDYLEQGMKTFHKEPDRHIEETLFFYPLTGILHRLTTELANEN